MAFSVMHCGAGTGGRPRKVKNYPTRDEAKNYAYWWNNLYGASQSKNLDGAREQNKYWVESEKGEVVWSKGKVDDYN